MSGKKRNKIFPLSDEELYRLSQENSGIVLKTDVCHKVKVGYSSLPVNSMKFKEAVAKELNRRILKFNKGLDDVVLRFLNIRIRNSVEAGTCRRLNVKCLADMFVFKPQFDKVMSAVINKKSKNHIGCVMYDVFNVSIVKPNDVAYSQWLGRDVNIGDKISFKALKVDVAEVIPYIVGELVGELADVDCDSDSCVEICERDSVISVDHSSCVTSEERFSDLDDVLETLYEERSKKRKMSDIIKEERSPKRKKFK